MTPLDAITAALRSHYLSPDRSATDADGNAPCVCGGWHEPGPMGNDEDDWDTHMAEVALAAIQGLYVPPPPGSDRDQLPAYLLAVLDVAPYLSTGCQVAQALEAAAERHPDLADELLAWAARKHASCRCNHKSTGQLCVCPHHPVPIAATTEQPPD